MNKLLNVKEKNVKENIKNERVYTAEDRTININNSINNKYMKILNINIHISQLSLIQLKNAYIRESKLYHPDKGGDIERMKDINLAYAKLKEFITHN